MTGRLAYSIVVLALCQTSSSVAQTATDTLRVTGVVEPADVVDVGALVYGPIQKLGVDPGMPSRSVGFGAHVKQGAILAEIDPSPYEFALEHARIELNRAEAMRELADAKVRSAEQKLKTTDKGAESFEVAKAELEVARAESRVQAIGVDVAKLAVSRAAQQREYCTVRSPVDGIVIDCNATVGQAVSATSPNLFLIGNDSKNCQVWAPVSEADLGRATVGNPVRFTVAADPRKTYTGRVELIHLNATMKNSVIQYTVVIATDDNAHELVPYMSANVEIMAGQQ